MKSAAVQAPLWPQGREAPAQGRRQAAAGFEATLDAGPHGRPAPAGEAAPAAEQGRTAVTARLQFPSGAAIARPEASLVEAASPVEPEEAVLMPSPRPASRPEGRPLPGTQRSARPGTAGAATARLPEASLVETASPVETKAPPSSRQPAGATQTLLLPDASAGQARIAGTHSAAATAQEKMPLVGHASPAVIEVAPPPPASVVVGSLPPGASPSAAAPIGGATEAGTASESSAVPHGNLRPAVHVSRLAAAHSRSKASGPLAGHAAAKQPPANEAAPCPPTPGASVPTPPLPLSLADPAPAGKVGDEEAAMPDKAFEPILPSPQRPIASPHVPAAAQGVDAEARPADRTTGERAAGGDGSDEAPRLVAPGPRLRAAAAPDVGEETPPPVSDAEAELASFLSPTNVSDEPVPPAQAGKPLRGGPEERWDVAVWPPGLQALAGRNRSAAASEKSPGKDAGPEATGRQDGAAGTPPKPDVPSPSAPQAQAAAPAEATSLVLQRHLFAAGAPAPRQAYAGLSKSAGVEAHAEQASETGLSLSANRLRAAAASLGLFASEPAEKAAPEPRQVKADRTAEAKERTAGRATEPKGAEPRAPQAERAQAPSPAPLPDKVPVPALAPAEVGRFIAGELRAAAPAGAAPLAAHHALPSNSSVRQLDLKLHPVELGAVTARLRAVGSQLSVEISAETPEARRQLEAEGETIRKALEALGFSVGEISVSGMPQAAPAASAPDGGAPAAQRDGQSANPGNAGGSAPGSGEREARGERGGFRGGDPAQGEGMGGRSRAAAGGDGGGIYI